MQDFAQVLGKIGGTQITPEDVANYAKTKTETKNVKLNNAVPIELRYETVVVSDGKLYIYRDVYDRGTNTEENLRAALEAHGVSLDQLSEAERAPVITALRQWRATQAAIRRMDSHRFLRARHELNTNARRTKTRLSAH